MQRSGAVRNTLWRSRLRKKHLGRCERSIQSKTQASYFRIWGGSVSQSQAHNLPTDQDWSGNFLLYTIEVQIETRRLSENLS